ncbi:sigma-70 family RNA polymerase sigma factor [uncultured Arthrobacter sp.]|uniref:sigma-70 family RNA polymerase sigma factor n=1 Tax=uncultured Arthrobacter sp. TaxID=114050 RepID=UPI0026364676|nr:sigma-70 family RNA polymerase sigma factor [uncultured Arthrobacter sp.]
MTARRATTRETRHAHKYNPAIGSAMSWLMTITHHRAVDRVRSQQASADREFRWGTANQFPGHDVVAETVADRMEAQALIRCLRELSPLQREAISLAYLDCLTYREVAAHLSKPAATVKSRIRDGLKQLRTRMDEA